MTDFGSLTVGDEFVYDGRLYMVVISAGGSIGTAMSLHGGMTKFSSSEQVRQV